ncbi:MAG: uroporphyrinogen-III C-methyltransferase [Rhodospirillales bacterium]|nr:uroporphyrinogen-III C-methyltransferase [Rhodospirillales bacterium]
MNHFPIFLDIKGRPVVVVGGGEIAARRVEMAVRAGARVTVIASEACPALEEIALKDGVERQAREFDPSDLQGCVIVLVATDDEDLNKRVSSLAQDAGIPVNVADRLSLCTFIMPAIIDRSPLLVAVSSGGEAPILSRVLKARLETFVPAGLGRLARFARGLRDKVQAAIPNAVKRRRFWEDFIDGPIAEYVLSGKEEAAQELVEKALEKAGPGEGEPDGEVYLVGSGPGDPDLLTFRALRLMQQADVVLHDRLVPDGILDLVRRDAERVFVGKKPGDHTMRQEEISQLMVTLARQGKRVLRLKSGDPFVFGRGGEEIEALAEEGIAFQVVPGVSAANGCASYAGIPLTHRDHAHSCVFVTGHMKDGAIDLNWGQLIQPRQTLVVYMGLSSLPKLTGKLIEHGADPKTPAAIVDNGTREGQRVVDGTLGDIAEKAAKAVLSGPAVIIVGSVVKLREKLSWFNRKAV